MASLKKGQEANWLICKAQNKLGGGSHKAGQVKSGDFIYIWLSGSGWLAKCLVTSDAAKPSISNPAPWKDGREYKYVFGIKVIEELDPPVLLGHKKRLQEVTRISQNKIQWFSDLDSGETDRLNSFFTSSGMLASMPTISWPPKIDEELSRKDISDTVGGSLQSGITSCRGGLEFLVFTSSGGEKYGLDKWEGWNPDGTFSYTGQGTTGNQTIEKSNNKSLLEANDNDKPLHLFSETSPDSARHRYLGCVILADPPFRWERAPDVNGDERDVVVFTFIPLESAGGVSVSEHAIPAISIDDWTPPSSDGFERSASAGGRSVREEHKLQADFGEWLRRRGNDVRKIKINLGSVSLEPDLIDATENLVIEAKSSGARGYVRTAIGQVLDYRHLLSKQGCEYSPAVLLPFLPSEDLVSLLDSIGITLIVQDSSGFKYYRPHAS